jgi:ribosome-binding factor A
VTSYDQKSKGIRPLRVGEQLRRMLSDLLSRGDLGDSLLRETSVTITEVRVSPDLKNATVYVMPLKGEAITEVLEILEICAPQLRKRLGGQLKMKFTPKLRFKEDKIFSQVDHLEKLLHSPRVARDVSKVPEEDDSA